MKSFRLPFVAAFLVVALAVPAVAQVGKSEGILDANLASEQELKAVLVMLHEKISPDLSYEVRQVDAIAWAPTAKRQDVLSLI